MSVDETQADSIPPGTLIVGETLGRYRLERVLGQGGMGVVWAARDGDLERTVAIKVLRHATASDALRKRLLREARAMARLKHPNVLTVYEVGTHDGRDFIAMELVDGGSLQDWLAQDPEPDEIWSALLAAGRGLAAAHEAGLVHRDFKPHNVLRSNDGRVLVTDFGLARGLGHDQDAADPLAATLPPDGGDSVLDVPLTQTGVLIGTPAYMAPEQFVGAEPDPRTDQFAFCITAWQMLTGARPFDGRSIDELREAASGGVAHVQASLPDDVRAVLARGLTPDPEQRWPSLAELLDALEATRAPRSRRVPLAIGFAAVFALGAVVMIAIRDDDSGAERRQPSPCGDPVVVLGEAASLAGFGEPWTAAYEQVCSGHSEALFPARLGCLLGARDRAAVLASLGTETADAVIRTGHPSNLPDIDLCTSMTPIGSLPFPDAQPLRGEVVAALRRATVLPSLVGTAIAAEVAALDSEANRVAWPPLAGMLRVQLGNELLRRGDHAGARAMFARSVDDAQRARDDRTAALARLGLFDVSLEALAQPSSQAPVAARGSLHEELEAARLAAERAVDAAGRAPVLQGLLAASEARAYFGASQWYLHPALYRQSMERAAQARSLFERGDPRVAARMAAFEANLRLRGADAQSVEDASHVARSAQDVLRRARLALDPQLEEILARVAFLRGELAGAHYRYDAMDHVQAPDEELRAYEGKVVDAAGKQVAGAVVAAWIGELAGDAQRAYTDPRAGRGEITRTRGDGMFTVRAPAGAAIVAEHDDARSIPQVATSTQTLRLVPTSSMSGTVQGYNTAGLDVFAQYSVGAQRWVVRAPVRLDMTFQLGGLPRGATPVFGAYGPAGTGTRRVLAGADRTTLAWPFGQVLDVIVRSARRGPGTVWVLRSKLAPKTVVELDALAQRLTDVASASITPIGAGNTDAGRALYRAGDRHAVITGNPAGDVTVCAVVDGALGCVQTMVTLGRIRHHADGRFGADATAVVVVVE